MFRYINEDLSLNNYTFGDFVDPVELEIKDTTDTARSASHLDLHTSKLTVWSCFETLRQKR